MSPSNLFAVLSMIVLASLAHAQFLSPLTPLSPPVVQLPKPYSFGYEFGDGLGMNQYRHESADGTGSVKGTYGYLDGIGVFRNVEYTADKDGFRSVIRSNEPGLSNHVAADAPYIVQPPPPAAAVQGLRPIRFVASPVK
ncbi:cuticle protein 16.8 [Trichonephila clavata]|uniref:Cuticle protein 16.8 n=1 Tax=Trichonephila clavata TaxID=2740835 RepID=A0A8X6GZZ6_TRICU|nr:cuticle protein 16.8 [Trichonephila clavata]